MDFGDVYAAAILHHTERAVGSSAPVRCYLGGST